MDKKIVAVITDALSDPSEVYRDDKKKEQIFNFFYRIDKGPKFVVAVVKVTVNKGKITHVLTELDSKKKARRSSKKSDVDAVRP